MHKDTFLGTFDYFLKPWLRDAAELHSWAWRGTGPMNGQPHRQEITKDIIERMGARAIVETGTYRGVTTEFLAQTGIPVHTIEFSPRLFAYSTLRLRKYPNVQTHVGSSPEVLQTLAERTMSRGAVFAQQPPPAALLPGERVFFYLDAHWDAHIPLAQELAVIQQYFKHSVVMVDDFAVPGDSYRWLDRGPNARLDETSLRVWNDKRRWYPAVSAWREAGQNTGWCVLAQDDEAARCLDSLTISGGLRRGPAVYGSTTVAVPAFTIPGEEVAHHPPQDNPTS